MAAIKDPQWLLKNARPDTAIGPLDGLVGALVQEGQYFITSANQTQIFSPPLGPNRKLQLRLDSRYGKDDHILWPQPYVTQLPHLAAIPRHNSLPEHEIIWWTAKDVDFVPYQSSSLPISGLGKLSPEKYSTLRLSVGALFSRVERYKTAHPNPQECRFISSPKMWLEHCLYQVQSVHTTFQQLEFIIRDIQRGWLELWAALDYMEIYKPRMDGHLTTTRQDQVADTIGVFTTSTRVAQDHFIAGLPCWLMRASAEFTDQNILKVVDLVHPEDSLSLNLHRHYPVIFQGPASSIAKYNSIIAYARNFLCSADPFSSSLPSGSTSPASSSQASSSTNPPVGGTSTQPQHGRSGGHSKKTRTHGGRKPTGYQQPAGRDKFETVSNSAIAPVSISSWATALAAVNRDPARVDPRYQASRHSYSFPDPGIFIATNDMRRARYFATWKAILPACIYRLSSASSSPPLQAQEWRDILIGDIASKTAESRTALARQQANRLLGSAMNHLGIDVSNVSPATAPAPAPLDDAEAQWLLWQLTELNFRFELHALDKRIGPAGRDESERQSAIRECLQTGSLLVVDREAATTGLQSDDWRSRLPCLLQLRTLMKSWPGVKPPALLQDLHIRDYKESDVALLEDAVARFYTDSFFCFFGRAAIIPARLT